MSTANFVSNVDVVGGAVGRVCCRGQGYGDNREVTTKVEAKGRVGRGRCHGQGHGDGGVVSTMDVVVGRWRGRDVVDEVVGTAEGLLSWLRPREEGKGPSPWTIP